MKLNTVFKATIATLGTTACMMGVWLWRSESAVASNRFETQVGAQLITAALGAGLSNYQPTHDPLIDVLYAGRSKIHPLNLHSGVTYGVVSVCDEDCTDVDLKLYDEDGNLVDSDIAFNDVPVVGITPRWTGRFYLEVDMASCHTSYCYYGVGVFGR